MTPTEFGARFKAARQATGMTQAEAAAALGVAQPRIAEYENGVRVPPTLRLIEIVETLGLDPRIFFPQFFLSRQARR